MVIVWEYGRAAKKMQINIATNLRRIVDPEKQIDDETATVLDGIALVLKNRKIREEIW